MWLNIYVMFCLFSVSKPQLQAQNETLKCKDQFIFTSHKNCFKAAVTEKFLRGTFLISEIYFGLNQFYEYLTVAFRCLSSSYYTRSRDNQKFTRTCYLFIIYLKNVRHMFSEKYHYLHYNVFFSLKTDLNLGIDLFIESTNQRPH